MIGEAIAGKTILAIGAAAVFCGITLYAVGQTLDYLFADVDPKRAEAESDTDALETAEKPIADPA